MNELEKSWLAGFIDGEGYVGITFQRKKETRQSAPSVRLHPYLIITNTNEQAIRDISKLLGVGRVYNNISKNHPKSHKNAFQLKITKYADLLSVLEAILPYLKCKAEQCKILTDYIKRRQNIVPVKGRGHRGETSFSDFDDDVYKRLLILNKRGK